MVCTTRSIGNGLRANVIGIGTGKTSLIRAIVQQCPDIVHMDPTTSLPTFLATPRPHSRGKKADRSATRHITELYASTRAYPAWWSELEDSKAVLRRRKSMGDTVLERNVCFVDTPGGNADGVVRYVEGLLHKCSDLGVMSDGEILGVLSGDGGCQVDVCLFLFPDGKPQRDLGVASHLLIDVQIGRPRISSTADDFLSSPTSFQLSGKRMYWTRRGILRGSKIYCNIWKPPVYSLSCSASTPCLGQAYLRKQRLQTHRGQ